MKPPPVFQSATFAAAMAEARAKGVWLIVAATSASSELAQMMEKTSWRNAQVATWFENGAIAVRIDVEAEPELARTLKVTAAPAVMAFKNGEERDRIAGFLDSARLLMWLMSLERQTRTLYDKAIRKGGGDLERDMQGRLAFAKALLHDQSYLKATEHYVWLWTNIERVDPDMSGVRRSFMASEIEELVGRFRPARERFEAIRDQTGTAAASALTSLAPRLDWVVLNDILGDGERTIEWFDGVKADPNAESIVRGVGRFLIKLLKARRRWADLGRLYRDPLRELAVHHEIFADADMTMMSSVLPKDALDKVKKVSAAQFRETAADLYASLRAAGRIRDAKAVHEEALRLDPSDEMKAALEHSPVPYD